MQQTAFRSWASHLLLDLKTAMCFGYLIKDLTTARLSSVAPYAILLKPSLSADTRQEG